MDIPFAQVVDELGEVEHPGGDLRLEFCLSGEDDNGIYVARGKEIEAGLYRLNVSKVLEYRVLELELVSEQDLGPFRLRRVGKDPTFESLCLDNEYSEPGYEDVIDLGRAVFELKGDVIQQVIVRRTEIPLEKPGHRRFSAILGGNATGGPEAANDETDGKCEEDRGDVHVTLIA